MCGTAIFVVRIINLFKEYAIKVKLCMCLDWKRAFKHFYRAYFHEMKKKKITRRWFGFSFLG